MLSFKKLSIFIALVSILPLVTKADSDWKISGDLTGEYRYFDKSVNRTNVRQSNVSLAFEPEFYKPLENSKDNITITPFIRIDENDSDRSDTDIRELKWHKIEQSWELTLGVNSIFWGVTETIHLVNIVNQIDLVDNPDGETVLGQPMANLTLIRDWGTIDLYVLPYFRERTYAGREGRPVSAQIISNDAAIYESGAEEWHTDFAARWSKTAAAWDIGLSYFYGTSRDPRFDPSQFVINSQNEIELIPIYDIVEQFGLDVQGTFESWLVKLEAISRSGQLERYVAAAFGVEYSFYDIASTGLDIGIVAEYLFDERNDRTDSVATENDITLGLRFTLNDINSTELLVAVGQDADNKSQFYFVEGSRRVGNSYKISLEARGVNQPAKEDPLFLLENDNFVQFKLGYYF